MINNQIEQQQPPQPPPTQPGFLAHKPSRAALCAVIPGIGAVYNREYGKAVVHFSVFAGLALIAEAVELFGLAAFAFYVFTIIDSYRSAEAIARGHSAQSPAKDRETSNLNLLMWGGLLIGMGVLFLLDNLGAIQLRDAIEFWPVLLIGLGVYLVVSQFLSRKTSEPAPPLRAPDQKEE